MATVAAVRAFQDRKRCSALRYPPSRKKIDLATGETRRGPGFSSRVGRPRAGVELIY